MKTPAPKIDKRSFNDMLEQMKSMVPFYTPEWNPAIEKESGQALMKIYLHMLEQVIARLNQVPDKNFIKFLDMLGIKMQPAQSATAQLTFKLAEGTKEHVTVPKGTLVAGEGTDGKEITFETEADLRVTPSILQEIYSFDGEQDEIFVHTNEFNQNQKFYLITGQNQQERSLYLGHAELLSQTNPTTITINFDIATGATGGILQIAWEYWDGKRWVELQSFLPSSVTVDQLDDTTELFRHSGQMVVKKEHIGEIAIYELFGKKSRWLRCRLKNKLPATDPVQLPVVNGISLSVKPIDPFSAELAFNNDIPLALEEKTLEVSEIIPGLKINLSIAAEVRKDQNQINLGGNFAGLKVEDLIKFSNETDPPEIMIIKEILTSGNSNFRVDKNFKYSYQTTDGVKFLTKVTLKQIENFTFNSKIVILKEDEKKEIASLEWVVKTNDEKFIEAIYIDRFEKTAVDDFNANSLVLIPRIKPFGELPTLFDTFYVASDEAFSKKEALITLDIDSEWANDSDPLKQDSLPNAVLSWEYWNGKSWQNLNVNDRTNRFEHHKEITFTCPIDIDKSQVNGQEKYWIRVRIIDGDYGREIILIPSTNFLSNVEIAKGKVYYPIINSLKINYQVASENPQHCFSRNNLDDVDHIKALLDTQKTFTPFVKFPEQSQGVLLGFDNQLVGGPLKILFDLTTEQVVSENETLKMEWFFWSGEKWDKINAQDKTKNLTQIGLLEFSIPLGFQSRKLFDKKQFWIKGAVANGQFISVDSNQEGIKVPEIKGIFPNSTTAVQASVVEDEVLGTNDLTADQAFQLLNPLIISQQLLITEPFPPSEEEKQEIIQEEGEDALVEIKDERDEIQGYRVRWHEVDDFYDSKPKSRHYVVDKRQGIILFGDGVNALVPPRGADNIRINYHFGGGKNGNVAKEKITGLKNAIPFVNEVTNHLPADGGSETETIEEVLERGPKQLKNRDRAVTSEDFEALARNVRKITRAKCLPHTDDKGNFALSHVSIIIVPDTQTANEDVSRALLDVVSQYLNKQSSILLSTVQDIHVHGAEYIEIRIEATVIPISLEATARADEGVINALKRYIHPLTGGKQGKGWEFGKNICRSEIFALLESISDVDHVDKLDIYADGKLQKEDDVFIDKHKLPFSGEHKVNIHFDSQESAQDKNGLKPECIKQDVEFCSEGN